MALALRTAAKLKPEVRLAQALSEYCACLGESRAREFKSLRTKSPPTAQDVIALTEEINRDGSRNHRAWMPYATRMAMFLDKVQTLSRLGDFMVASSQNLMASGIWATIKVTLGIAVGSLTFFKKISELFLKIGRSSSITQELTEVFPKSRELQELLCEYLTVLVTFCKEVVLVFKKPTIIQLASPFVAFFDKEASKFETDMAHISSAIDRKAAVLLSQTQVESSNTIAKMSKTLAQWSERSESKKELELLERSKQFQAKLSSHSDQLQQSATWRRFRKKGDVRWVFDEKGYQEWLPYSEGSANEARVLLIHGKLGSGKTVLLANVVAHLRNWRPGFHTPMTTSPVFKTIIASYFCTDDYTERPTAEKILGSIIQQIVSQFEPGNRLIAELYQYFQQSGYSLESMLVALRNYLPRILNQANNPNILKAFIVLDGLDSCAPSVAREVIDGLTTIPHSEVINGEFYQFDLRVCVSLRTGSPLMDFIGKLLGTGGLNSIAMTTSPSVSEMKDFIQQEFERRRHIRTLDKELEDIIRDVLVGASNGMYLWVALQIEALFPLHGTALLSPSVGKTSKK